MKHNIFTTLFCKKRLRIRNPSARPYVPCKTFEEWREYVIVTNAMTKYLNMITEEAKKIEEFINKMKNQSKTIDIARCFDQTTHTPLN